MSNVTYQQKIDLLWKHLYGVVQTTSNKSEYEEYRLRHEQLRASDIWREDSSIPNPASAAAGIVEFRDIRLVADPSVVDNSAWVAVDIFANGLAEDNLLTDFIPPSFHPTYEIKVFSDAAKTKRIFNSEDETNWIFDYSAGILWLPNLDPAENLTEVYLVGYRYIGPKGMNPTFSGDVIDVLGDLTNGDFTGGYVEGFEENETRISDAIDLINRALNDFVPTAPFGLDEYELIMPGTTFVINDANIVLSEGATDNAGSLGGKPLAGNTVGKVLGFNLETDYVGPFGNGRSGILSFELNNVSSGSKTLTVGSDTGVYDNLEINQDIGYGSQIKAFYETLQARAVNLDLPFGLNGLSLKHTETGSTNTLFVVRDSSQVVPTIQSSQITESTVANLEFSSGIAHYGRGSRLLCSATVKNLATDIYLDTRNVEFSSGSKNAGPTAWAYPSAYGLPVTLHKGTDYNITEVPFQIDDTEGNLAHGTLNMQITARNANGTTVETNATKINFMRGGATTGISPVIEAGVPVRNLGTADVGFLQFAQRILLPNNATPTVVIAANTLPAWDSSAPVPAYEAKIVGGVLKHSAEDFSTSLPMGPDYSSHTGTQYATFWIQRKNVSIMDIEVEGTYSGMWVNLPGIPDQTLAPNGWMDCFANYVGWGVPGREVQAGCAIGVPAYGGSQTVTATFGYESSSNTLHNIILVRFRLAPGQAITGLRFSGATR